MQLLLQRKYFLHFLKYGRNLIKLLSMAKMEVLGAPFTQIDCTGALPNSLLKRSATQNYARSIINSLTMGRIAAF